MLSCKKLAKLQTFLFKNKKISACAVIRKSINPLLAGGCGEAKLRTFRLTADLAYFREQTAPLNYFVDYEFPVSRTPQTFKRLNIKAFAIISIYHYNMKCKRKKIVKIYLITLFKEIFSRVDIYLIFTRK